MGVIGDHACYPNRRSYFELEIDNCTGSANIMIGFVKKTESPISGYYTKGSGHMFYGCNGYFYRSGAATVLMNGIRFKKGDKIKSVIDPQEKKIYFYLND